MVRLFIFSILFSLPAIFFGQEENQPKKTANIQKSEGIQDIQDTWRAKNKKRTRMGYRVQVFNGNRQNAFNAKSTYLKVKEGYPVEVIFETPEYKTQIGNFRTKIEAEKALREIWKTFPSAFIVMCPIALEH